MSGGVDSAVAALAAQRAGHDVVAVTLELWADPTGDGKRSCCSPESVAGARALAHSLGLPHITLDLRESFGATVVDDFVAEHAAGRTPNPCVRCNGMVRFDSMLDLAEALGAARLATGHYARIARDDHGPLVAAAADANKDQSYMLARLDPGLLDRLWFPLAELDKPRVRELAAEARLAVADKPESQDLCFLAGIAANDLLSRSGLMDRPGPIVDLDGNAAGHPQRPAPPHSRPAPGDRRSAAPSRSTSSARTRRRTRSRSGRRTPSQRRRSHLEDLKLHRPPEQVTHVKLRYRSEPIPCRLPTANPCRLPSAVCQLEAPFEAATPGQTAVLLHHGKVVGAATIADPSNTVHTALPLAPPAHV